MDNEKRAEELAKYFEKVKDLLRFVDTIQPETVFPRSKRLVVRASQFYGSYWYWSDELRDSSSEIHPERFQGYDPQPRQEYDFDEKHRQNQSWSIEKILAEVLIEVEQY